MKLKFPPEIKITGRTSTMRGTFINAVIPTKKPSNKEINTVLKILNQNSDNLVCSYCGDKASEWEHFRAMVKNKLPAGYINEIYNLVPSCGKCNQSKRGDNWKEWMLGKAPNSPSTRNIKDLKNRIEILEKFELWSNKYLTKLPAKFTEDKDYVAYMKSCEKLIESFKKYQVFADKIKRKYI